MIRHKSTLILIFSILILCTNGCSKDKTKEVQKNENIESAINVETFTAIKKQIRPFIDTIGNLESYEEVVVSSEANGTLSRVNYREGNAVSRGTVLAYVNSTDYRLKVENAQAALNQAKAYHDNVKTEYERKKVLYEKEIISRQQFDDVATKLTLASSDIDKAQSFLSLARQDLNKTTVRSPISGIIKEKKIAAGDYVNTGTPLFEIIQINPLKLTFTVSEDNIGKIRKGQEVIFTVNAFPDREFKGITKTIYPNVEEETRNLKVEALVNNSTSELKPGMFAKAKIHTGNIKNIIAIPAIALLYEGTQIKVFTVDTDTAKTVPVKIGEKYGEMVEILQGLQENQNVVITGQQNLSEGVKINVAR